MTIGTAEDQIIARVRALFAGRLRAVESLPADFDDETFRRILSQAPGVFVVYGGGPLRDVGTEAINTARFALFCASRHASGEKARRRGDALEVGAYEMVETLVAGLHGHTLDMGATLTSVEVQNLFSGQLEKQGVAVYAVVFELPLVFEAGAGAGPSLDDFVTFHGDIDLAPIDGQAEAAVTVELEQP